MAAEILPTGNDGIETKTTKSWTPDRGEEVSTVKTGTAAALEASYQSEKTAAAFNSAISDITLDLSKGRGTLTIKNARTISTAPDPTTGGNQELLSVDVARAIFLAPYFAAVTSKQVAQIRRMIDDGIDDPTGYFSTNATLCYRLFAHMVGGYESYYETAYLFRRSFRTTSSKVVRVAAGNINTVQTLPALSRTLTNLIDSLPAGEWLKRPVQCRYQGRDGWDIVEEYLWSPKWSIVYGGTFTGGY